MGQNKGFLNLQTNLVINFHWICSIVKIYIICFVLAQILYLGKTCSWDIDQIYLSQSDCRIFKSTISHFSRTNWWNRLLHFDTTLQKLKVDRKFFGWTYSKMGGANLVSGLNLNVSQEWTGGINWLFACYYKFLQFKRRLKIFWGGHGQKWLWPV